MLNPGPKRKRIVNYPTPLIGDVLFYELVHLDRMETPEYGTPHPDTIRWPHHKLVFVKPIDEVGDHYQFWYAADRENQDLYNWESGIANLGGKKFDTVVRTYVIPRDEYDPEELQMGAAMPNVPVNRFPDPVTADGDNTTNDDDPPSYTNHVLAERDQIQIGDKELDSIYVVEKRTYIKRCSITTIQTEDFFGIGGSRVDNLYYRGEVIDGETVETHFATPNSDYWGWQDDGSQRDGQQLSENWFIISIINSITDVIDEYEFHYPTFSSINLPRRLNGSQLTFNIARGVGDMDQDSATTAQGESFSLSVGLADSCSSSISITPELGLTFHEPNGSYLPAMVYAFFLPQPVTMQAIIDRVSILHGSAVSLYSPPDTTTQVVTLVSGSASVSASANASVRQASSPNSYADAWEKSVSIDKRVSQTTQFLQITGIAGGGAAIANGSQTDEVSAEAAMMVYINSTAGNLNCSAQVEDSVDVTASVTSVAGGINQELNEGSSDGDFITRISVEHYRFERAKIFVEVTSIPAYP